MGEHVIKIDKPNIIISMFRTMNKFAGIMINLLTRLILVFVYFIFLFTFAVFIIIFTDLLDIRNYRYPRWIKCAEITDKDKFMRQQ